MKIQWGVSAALAATVALTGCKKKDESEAPKEMPKATEVKPAEPPPPPKPTPLTGEALAKFYLGCFTAYNDKKWDEFSNCIDDNIVLTMVGMPEARGKAAQLEMVKMQSTAFPDGKGSPQIVLVNGRNIASVTAFTGTHTGPMKTPGMEIPPTNKKIGMLALHSVEVSEANKATKEMWIEDWGTMMAQLGLSKGPARDANITVAPTPEIVIAKNDEVEKKNLDAHKMGWEKFNKHDKTLFDIMADDAVMSSQADPKDCKGKKECGAHHVDLWTAFPDITITPKAMWAAGDYTFAVGQITGTNTGDMKMMKLKKTGKKIDMTAGEIAKWENGKLKKGWFFMNGMEFATQLGLVPPPTAAKPGDKAAAPADKGAMAPADKGMKPADKAAPAPADKAAPAPAPK